MKRDIRTSLTLISTQLECIMKVVDDEKLKVQLKEVYINALNTIDQMDDGNSLANELSKGYVTLSFEEQLINRALKFVEANLLNPSYSVEQLSRDMNMDRTGLYRKLIALTGQAPTMFIRSARLRKAILFLKQKRYSQAEIAEKVGFSNAAYFSRCFKAEYGVSPSHYQVN